MRHSLLRASSVVVFIICLVGLIGLSVPIGPLSAASSQTNEDSGSSVVREMEVGARHFLSSLEPAKMKEAKLAFDGEERFNFHYIPRERKGVAVKHLTPAQRKLAYGLIGAGLSRSGFRKALDIMFLEQILFDVEKRPIRDPDLYYLSVFGEPSAHATWGLRVEGHHLSLNFALRDGRVVSSFPSFWGANPANVLDGPQKGMSVLADEERLGRDLFEEMGESADILILAEPPRDIITAASRRVEIDAPVGAPASDMNEVQRAALMRLIELYAHRLHPELAESELRRVREAGLENVRFGWAGGGSAGEPHYYRVHGPTFLIEYDNTQNDANHIHTVWRDPEGDWGETDPLTEHYANAPHHQNHRHAKAEP